MFGNVVTFRQFHWPPMLHDKPRFSILRSMNFVADAPVAAVNESPIAAITLISPKMKNNCSVYEFPLHNYISLMYLVEASEYLWVPLCSCLALNCKEISYHLGIFLARKLPWFGRQSGQLNWTQYSWMYGRRFGDSCHPIGTHDRLNHMNWWRLG